MNSDKLISIEDADLDVVAGGLGLNLGAAFGRLANICVDADVSLHGVSVGVSANVGPIKVNGGLGVSLFGGKR